MANFNQALKKVLKWEGGYANHPADKGGSTNSGITQTTYNYYYEGKDVKDITDEQVWTIYRVGFWNKIWGSAINSQSVAELLFDFAVNSGVKTAIRKIQRLVRVEDDGIVGKVTIAAINAKDPHALFNELYDVRVAYYKQIVAKNPSQKVFYQGWMNRLKSYKFES